MKIESVIPILYSEDVTRSIKYYTEVLCFKESWTWDEDPSFGAVIDGQTTIFFCRGDQGHKGTWLALNIDKVIANQLDLNAILIKIYLANGQMTLNK